MLNFETLLQKLGKFCVSDSNGSINISNVSAQNTSMRVKNGEIIGNELVAKGVLSSCIENEDIVLDNVKGRDICISALNGNTLIHRASGCINCKSLSGDLKALGLLGLARLVVITSEIASLSLWR